MMTAPVAGGSGGTVSVVVTCVNEFGYGAETYRPVAVISALPVGLGVGLALADALGEGDALAEALALGVGEVVVCGVPPPPLQPLAMRAPKMTNG
jgi:hypothetical protein